MPWSANTNTNTGCEVSHRKSEAHRCFGGVVVNIPEFSESPTRQLANQLRTYVPGAATVHNLLDDLTHAAGAGLQAPYWRPILGKPEDFFLSNDVTVDSYQSALESARTTQLKRDFRLHKMCCWRL